MGHTPGKWVVKHQVNVFGGDRSVAACGGYATNTDQGEHVLENEANARLIATAPLLLEACRAFIDADMYWTDEANAVLELMESAVAKAEGRNP